MAKKDIFGVVLSLSALILFITMFCSVFSLNALADGEKNVYSGTAQTGEVNIDGNPGYFTVASNIVRLKYLDTIVVARNGICAEENGLKMCVSDVNELGANVNVFMFVADLIVEKTVANKEYNIGELIPVKVVVKNNGKTVATNVRFKDDITGFSVINPTGCSVEGNYLVFTTQIGRGNSASCTYNLKSTIDGEIYRTAEVEFFNGFKETIASASGRIKVKPFGFDIKSNLENKRIDVGIENLIWFNFTLKSPKETNVKNLILTFPDSLIVKDNKGIILLDNKFKWAGMVDIKKNVYLTFNVSAKSTNNGLVNAYIDFVADQIGYQNKDFNITMNFDEPIISFREINLTSLKGDNAIYFKNINKFVISDIKCSVGSVKIKVDVNEFKLEKVDANSEEKLGDISYEASEDKADVFAECSYSLPSGGVIKMKKVFVFDVKNLPKSEIKKVDTISQEPAGEVIIVEKSFLCKVFGWMTKKLC